MMFAIGLVLSCAALSSGCVTAQQSDPLEPMNRRVFELNEGVDRFVLKPVAATYESLVPGVVRTGFTFRPTKKQAVDSVGGPTS